ncbi:hypothetical protein MACK_004178 (apicoplast) [Theileria orientalis]|uniref:Uncharacterized protein n=1 Tax=Theileria orientalis TaxID=68886 RepID=A0A976SI51_THEOR|nr:hypothetical protein MACK_004173 [Theileria orientalis]UVC46385.1 hypothetical protein MACK_004178 [Theileria orientalis]
MKNINTSEKIIKIINLDDKINYLKIITNLSIYALTVICEFYYSFILISIMYLDYNNNMLKILKSLNIDLILYALNYKFTRICDLIYNFIYKINLFNVDKSTVLKVINTYSSNYILTKLNLTQIVKYVFKFYYTNKKNLKLIITLLNYYINKINLYILLKNKILKIINIYDNQLTLTKLNYYNFQLKLLKLKIENFKLDLNDSLINYLNLKIYSYILLLLLYTASLTIPLALIAFP